MPVQETTTVLRDFQQRFVEVALAKAQRSDKFLIANVHPGSGKTLACLAAADLLMREGYVEAVVVLVPRINLAQQFEQDWAELRSRLPWRSTLRGLYHTDNRERLVAADADGYISTYDSLVSKPYLHLREIRARRTLLICDEMQQLGVDYDGTVTQSATEVKKAAELATMFFGLSGTPERADGSQLLFATYSDLYMDEQGRQRRDLQADIETTYRQGVAAGYLRPFEATLHDGTAVWQQLGTDPEELTLSQMQRSIHRIINHNGYWQPLIDRFVSQLIEDQELIDPRLCGLVAAHSQKHAKQIYAYIRKHYPQLRALVAVSEDGGEAQESLKLFRAGKYDILVTVQMAYVGYDYKPISNIAVLTAYRTDGYLRQLFARGLRMWSEIPADQQACRVFVPDDPRMRTFVERLRTESKAGVMDRDQQPGTVGESDNAERVGEEQTGQVVDAWLTSIYARGIDPSGDMTPEEYDEAERIRKQLQIPVPVSKLMEFVRMFSTDHGKPTFSKNGIYRTNKEQMEVKRRELAQLAVQFDRMMGLDFGSTNRMLYRRYKGSVEECATVEEVDTRLMTIKGWIERGTYED